MKIKENPITKTKQYIKKILKKGESMIPKRNMWFDTEVNKIRYKDRINRINDIDEYLRRDHKVLSRPDFEFKEKTYETAKIVLQTLKSIVKFHSGYICGNPVSITGDKEFVSVLNLIYKKGNYNKIDLEIANDLIKYGDAFEYVYLDDKENIRSKIIRNKDSYPLYDGNGQYYSFVEHWKDVDTRREHYIVYYPDKVEIYEDHNLIDTKVNLTGLPIWYSGMDKSKYDKFGDPFLLDLIPLMDSIEHLLSKLDDAVTTLSLNPLGVVSGQRIDSSIPNNITGVVLNLEDGSDFKYANAQMDRESIKLELDYIIQQFYAVACVPSSILGQSNVANVSETSVTMLYQQTENFNRQFIVQMLEGFFIRLEYIRKLMRLKGQTVSDDVYDSINFSFNLSRPIDQESNMKNMQIQRECGAISKQTIIDRSPYTTDTALELQRLEDEARAELQQFDNNSEEIGLVVDTKTKKIEIDDKVD